MSRAIQLNVNGETHTVNTDPETPLLYVLRNDLGLKGPKFGCGLEQCNSCKVLIDGNDVPSCLLPLRRVGNLPITTIEGLGTADALHPLQEAFVEEQAIQCGYCASGMIIAAQGLLNRTRHPTDEEIREALSDNICRCGVYDRIRRAIKMRIGQPHWDPIYEVVNAKPVPPPADSPQLPLSLQRTPALDAWIRINQDETITVFSGKVELGQGIKTALTQIAAEELDVALSRIQLISGETGVTPNEGATAGSMSLQMSGAAIRLAAAEARHHLLTLAFEQIESQSSPAELQVVDGEISDLATGRSTTYWALFAGESFGIDVTGRISPKNNTEHQLVGHAHTRLDLINKVTGVASFVHDIDMPNMLHGRILRPPSYQAKLTQIDTAAVAAMPGVVDVIQDGRFIGIIAEREAQAVEALESLRDQTKWHEPATLPTEPIDTFLQSQPSSSNLVVDGTATTNPIPPKKPIADGTHTLNATYTKPYHIHGSLGPSAAVAIWQAGQLTVWSHSQAVFLLQQTLAEALEIDANAITVNHVEGAGCYGHNGADDAALDAAMLARTVAGRAVSLKWMRHDEHGWEPYGSAMKVALQASLNEAGEVIDWNHDVWSFTHSTRPQPAGSTHSGLLAAWHRAQPVPPPEPRNLLGRHFGGYRNADPLYSFPNKRIINHFVHDSPLRVSAVRSLGAFANVFAIESFMDELAAAAGRDPIEFRLAHLTDERAKAVLRAAAEKAQWQAAPRDGNASGSGRGVGFAQYKNIQCYAAVIVDVDVDIATGTIQLKHAVIAADAGQIINPDGLSNQLEGGFVQAASWALAEAVTYDQQRVTSLDWDSYPLLRFYGVPTIETVLLNRPDFPPLGSGEATQGPTPAAIANAIFDAVGIRLRELPLTLK